MQKAIIGKKVGMTQIFDENGHVIPVTVIEAGPCVVAQKKTIENDGYVSVQLAYGEVAEKKLSKPELGHLKKAGISARKHLKEFKLDNAAELEVGAEIKVDTFAAGDHVDVTGISKGHGYQGVIKRSSSDPSRIFKGKIGAGQMGVEQVTVQNLDVVKVDADLNMLVIRGAIPGPKGGLVYVKSTVKKIKETHGEAGVSKNPQKASARNPQKASARG